jgi:hypothetical protein
MNVHGEIKSVGVDSIYLSPPPPPHPLSTSVYRAQEYVKFEIFSMFRCAVTCDLDAVHDRMLERSTSMSANWSKRKLANKILYD